MDGVNSMTKPKVWMDENGIMKIQYPSCAYFSLQTVKSEYDQRLAITRNKHPVLFYVDGIVDFTEETQKFMTGEIYGSITLAAAFIQRPTMNYSLLAQYYIENLKLSNSRYPVEFFNQEKEALRWLRQYTQD